MTTVARTFVSIPQRSATATWDAIVELLAPDANSAAHRELTAIAGTVSSCIADEALANDAIVVYGSGPRVRVYALYGDAAIEGDDANESPLSFVPTEGDWHMSIPCFSHDLAWVQRSLAAATKRVAARALGDDVADDNESRREADAAKNRIVLDSDAFFRS